MTLKTTKLRDAITFALAASATALVGTGTAFAQQPAASEQSGQSATNLDRIQVTGSRIRQTDIETSQPVQIISREEIDRQGFQSVADILQNISAVGTPPLSRAAPLSSGENAGGTFISLRNLGGQRTLTLINGKRLGISTSGFSDISTIPAAAVERIEVLKDGASSIYGSDAIAGVINVITRSNFEGASASAYYGQYGEGDGAITKGDFVMGFTGDRGSLTLAAEWAKEDEVKSSDRPYSAYPRGSEHPFDGWTTVGQFGGFTTTATTPVPGLPTGTRVILRPGGDPRVITDYIAQDQSVGGCTVATAANPGPGTCVPGSPSGKSNTNEQTSLRSPLERRSLYADGIFNITDNVLFRTNLLYSQREADRQVAGYPLQATLPAGAAAPMSALSYFNPTGATISNWWRRGWEVPRVSGSDLTTYRFSGAFEGSFEFADRLLDWDVSYLHNVNKLVQTGYGDFNAAAVRASVGPSFLNAQGQVQCGTAAAPISFASCVPFNPFLPYGVEGPGGLTNNQALQDFFFQELHSTGETKTTVMAANLAGNIVSLPAGDLGFAFGLENRKEKGAFIPDALAATGGSTTLAAGPTSGGYSVDEAYLELQIPVLADLPFARELSFNAASRYSDYDTFGDTTNNKFGMKWKPFDSLLVRATVADGFRAPTIADLFGGGSQTFSFFTDPCDVVFGSSANNATTRANCTNGVGGLGALGAAAATYRQRGQGFTPITTVPAQTPVPFVSGSNPTLTPEQSKSKNVGLVWSPGGFLQGLNVAVDWWNVRVDNTIVTDTPTQILNDCYVQGIASRCSTALFVRDPSQFNIPIMTFGNRNAGYREVEGFDFDIAYRWNTENMGTFSFVSNSTYTSKDVFINTNDPRVPLSSVGFGSTFRIRSNANLSWQYGSFGVSWFARYYSSIKESCVYFTPNQATGATATPPVTESHLECNEITYNPTGAYLADGVTPASGLSRRNRTGSNTFNDVQVRWEAPWNATIALGVNNVLDRVGPTLYSQPSANTSYYGGFDIGRFSYMRYTQRF